MNFRIYQLFWVTLLFASCQKVYESVPLGQQVTPDLAFDPRDSLGKNAMVYLLRGKMCDLSSAFLPGLVASSGRWP